MSGMTVTAWFKQELRNAADAYRASVASGDRSGIVAAALRIHAAKGHVPPSFAKRALRGLTAVSP